MVDAGKPRIYVVGDTCQASTRSPFMLGQPI